MEAAEDSTVTLRCELTKPAAPVEWRKGSQVLRPSDKYKMKLEGTSAELVIHGLEPADAGDYSCTFGEWKTTASVTVKGTFKESTFCFSLPGIRQRSLGEAFKGFVS